MKYRVAALLLVLLCVVALVPAASAQSYPYVTYTVQQGDTLAKIGQKYCVSWQEIYQLNAAVIGPDPNNLKAGTVLYVPNICGAPPASSGNVYDRGPSMYASGTVTGNVYTVAAGDTWYSIGQRFGMPWETISTYNGGGNLYPGRQLIIPGLPSAPPAQTRYISITNPQPGAMLPNTFSVSGKGAGLPEGNVVVQAKDSAGRVLAQQATTLQGYNVGLGGEGTWSVSMTVNVGNITQGAIEATSPGVPAMAAVSITYSGAGNASAPPAGSGTVVYAPGQCTITGMPGAPMYAYPGGPQTGQFVAGGNIEAKQRTTYNGMQWYMIQPEAAMGNPPSWVPASSLSMVGQGCSQA
jgi:LysM repeat protein